MFKRAGGLAITLAISVAAMRIGAPTLGSGGAGAGGAKHPRPTKDPSALNAGPNSGGCTAYAPGVEPTPGKPYDSNSGAAKKKLDEFFGVDSVTEKDKISAQLTYAIALAPDPVHTHLGLMFDRQIAVLEQAAQDEGYIYNSSWLPWKSDQDPAPSALVDRQYLSDLADEREACPGLVLFRKNPDRLTGSSGGEAYSEGLVVFVVGEQPTGGINQDQWKNALDWLRTYAHSANATAGGDEARMVMDGTLRILGPTFTGSLASLERNLSVAYKAPETTAPETTAKSGADEKGTISKMFPEVRVLSGSVTGCSTIQWFQHRIQSLPDLNGRVRFGTFQENDSLHIFRFLEYLKSQRIQPREAAILSEDETAYAAGATDPVDKGSTFAGGETATTHANATESDSCDFPYAIENRPLHLVYPRDISALRDAYQKQSVFQSGDDSKHSVHSILKDDSEKDNGSEITDTLPTFGTSVSAVAQEAYLFGVVSFLRTHHAQYLILRCTNPLDYLFLTRFFHREYPEARIVTVGSDLLFRREIDTTEFRGVLALSSYPLIPRSQHWAKITTDRWEDDPHNHLIFDAHLSEGIYLASRYLLGGENLTLPWLCDSNDTQSKNACAGPGTLIAPIHIPRAFPSPDYATPFWLQEPGDGQIPTHPPTWLAVLGRDGYWPIAVMKDEHWNRDKEFEAVRLDLPGKSSDDASTKRAGPPSPGLPSAGPPSAGLPPSTVVRLDPGSADLDGRDGQHFELKMSATPPYTHQKPPPYSDFLRMNYPMSWLVCLLLSGLLAGYQAWGVLKGSAKPYRLFSIFRVTHRVSEDVLFASSSALALMPFVEVVGFGFFSRTFGIIGGSFGPRVGGAIALMIFFCLLVWSLLDRYGLRVLALFLAFLSLMVLSYTLAFASGINGANAVPLVYRMAHLTSGVSPLVPILLLTFGFYLWNWNALAGNLLLSPGCPKLPTLIGTGKPTVDNRNRLRMGEKRISQDVAEKVLKMARPLSFPLRIVALPLFLLLAAVLCFAIPRHLPLLSLEGTFFNWALNSLLLLGFLLTAGEGLRLYFTWVSLQRLLQALGRLRLRRTLAELRPIDANSLWSASGNVPRVQYRLFDRQLGAAHRILLSKPSAKRFTYLDRAITYGNGFRRGAESEVERGILWDKATAPLSPRVGNDPKEIREVMADAVAQVLNEILIPEWATEKTSLNFESDDEKTDGGKAKACKLPLSDSLYIRAAEEFVGFHYIGFIQNIAARIRTMTLSMLLLFVFVCFGISFYPFVPRTEISVWMILNLALIGSAVAWVYAGMERDEIMSYIANTKPGQLGTEFWLKLSGFLIGPVIGIVTTQFPSIADSVVGWLQPGLDAMK